MTRDAVTPAEVAGLAYSVFGLRGHASALPGEHDRNFVLTGHAGERHVLKLHPPGADPAGLDLQDAALSHLSAGRLPVAVPRVVPPSTAVDGARVRALSWVGGTPAALAAPLDAHGMASLGRAVAAVDAALASFQHPAMHRAHPWSMLTLVRDPASPLGMAEGIPDPRYRADVVAVLQDLPNRLAPALEALPGQVIHNDANDHNVLLDDAGRVCGLIDFGDLCWAPRVCGLAVACAYAMQGFDEPVTAVPPLVAGYHEVAPLAPAELAVLFDLIRARLALSACHAVRQHRDRPDNDYLLVSQDGVRALLRILAGDSAELAHLRFRAACGYDAVPAAHAVRAYLLGPDAAIGPVCPTPLAGAPVLDWSRGATGAGDPPPTRPAIGRYLEDRAVYAGDAFATGDPDQRRSLHLGVDIFLPAGEPVLAALDGVVHDVAWRPEPYDWGGIVVLAHRTADGVRFYTLSAHLDRGTAQRLTPGAPVVRGDVIGYLGTAQENGGWPPHLHLQLLTTTLDRGCAAYGVAAPGERALWESVSPDPNLLLGLAAGVRAEPDRPRADLLQARATSLSRALSLSYARPLTIVDGAGAHLYAADGRDYLDMVNNVCHVGHAHPRVVAAIAQQAARLNTNTRYLHPLLVSYARRLAATCPDPLSVVFLVNSGSEANDLALRLARAHTKARDVLVLDHAYHG
ncbi:MAG TPA: aminotransferase class III-fold pyridoxal phosphate-dependent enzyme, partial [Micromonosporaceae bacterium]|nr:aminotransferase class III-fold pyridoxal phosphate-dependent enzyme [Micromonosporaceae bacterium]